jgi:hypothetical protein
LPSDVLRLIALYVHVMPKHSYGLRRRIKRVSSLYGDETSVPS